MYTLPYSDSRVLIVKFHDNSWWYFYFVKEGALRVCKYKISVPMLLPKLCTFALPSMRLFPFLHFVKNQPGITIEHNDETHLEDVVTPVVLYIALLPLPILCCHPQFLHYCHWHCCVLICLMRPMPPAWPCHPPLGSGDRQIDTYFGRWSIHWAPGLFRSSCL